VLQERDSARVDEHVRATVHRAAVILPLRCNIPSPSSVPRQPGALRSAAMEIVGVVMLGSIVLWLSRQFDRHD